MKNFLITILFFTAYILFFAPVASADTVCQPIYGGGQSCIQTGNVLINKTVADPKTGAFVDNLGINDNKFSQDMTINFQITVTNTSNAAISKITVRDIFPRFVDFVAGPGNFDTNSKTLSFDVLNLNPNESRNFTVTGKIASADKLPSQTIDCEVNQALALLDSNTASQDNSQFCIQKQQAAAQAPTTTKGGLKVFPPGTVTTTPATGPEMLPLLALIPTGLAGIFLKRKKI